MNYREKLLAEGWEITRQNEDNNRIDVEARYLSPAQHRTEQLMEHNVSPDLTGFWQRFYLQCQQGLRN